MVTVTGRGGQPNIWYTNLSNLGGILIFLDVEEGEWREGEEKCLDILNSNIHLGPTNSLLFAPQTKKLPAGMS